MLAISRARTGGELCSNICIYCFFSLPQRKAGAFVCVSIAFSRSGFNLLKDTALGELCCRWCPF